MIDNRLSYTLGSSVEGINLAEDIARRAAAEAGFQEEEIHVISMAVREAAINAAQHGNRCDPNKKVQLLVEKEPDRLQITIRDEGKGFDPAQVQDPLAPGNLLRQSGRGIFLIRSYMDEVRFRRLESGMEAVLVKHLRGAPAEHKENPKL
ncbi:MAG: ATP-binding protein [Terriglobales bacterium]